MCCEWVEKLLNIGRRRNLRGEISRLVVENLSRKTDEEIQRADRVQDPHPSRMDPGQR